MPWTSLNDSVSELLNSQLLTALIKGGQGNSAVGFLFIAGIIYIFFPWAKKRQVKPVRLSPTGKTTLPTLMNPLRQGLREVIGVLPTQHVARIRQKLLYFTHLDLTFREGKRPLTGSFLVAYRYHQRLTESGWVLFFALLVGSAIARHLFSLPLFFLTILSWLWLGYELFRTAQWDKKHWKNKQWNNKKQSLKNNPPEPVMHAIAQLLCASLLCRLLLFLPNLSAYGAFLNAYISVSFFGAYAGMLRVMRSRTYTDSILCDDCESPLEHIETLAMELTEAEKTEARLESKVHESWKCPDCHYGSRKQDFSTHLVSYVLGHQDFQPCSECDALAVEVVLNVVQPSTAKDTGKGVTTWKCQCCSYTEKKSAIIPRRPNFMNNTVRH